MKNTHVSLRGIKAFEERSASPSVRTAAMQDLFIELVQILEDLKRNPGGTSGDDQVERWEDEEHIYLQTDLEAIFDAEIDINVHDGRFYIRMER